MNCPTCGRKIGPATKRCMYCGARVESAAAPAPPPAEAGNEAPPLPRLRQSAGYIRPRRNWASIAVIVAVLLVGGGFGLRVLLRTLRPPGDGAAADSILIEADGVHIWPREIQAPCEFRFTVTALEGDCSVASGKIKSVNAVSPNERDGLDANAAIIHEGSTRVLLGKCPPGPYAWAVFAGRKKPARVRVDFEFK